MHIHNIHVVQVVLAWRNYNAFTVERFYNAFVQVELNLSIVRHKFADQKQFDMQFEHVEYIFDIIAHLHDGGQQHHGYKGDPEVTHGTCGTIGERA